MHLRLYMPSTIDAPDDWSPDQRTRLQRIVMRAFERAVTTIDLPTARIEIVRAAQEESTLVGASLTDTLVELAQRQGDPKERLDEARLYSDGKHYGLPSYRDAGAQVEVPLQGATSAGTAASAGTEAQVEVPLQGATSEGTAKVGIPQASAPAGESELITSAGDRVVRQEFEKLPVIHTMGGTYIEAGGSPYVITGNLAHAGAWGRYLFGTLGFTILQRKGRPDDPNFYVVPLLERLSIRDLGGLGARLSDVGEQEVEKPGFMLPLKDYTIVSVVTGDEAGEDVYLFSTIPDDNWKAATFMHELNVIPENKRSVNLADVEAITKKLLRGSSGKLDLILNMDRTVFAVIPWEQRAEYLELLIARWLTGDKEKKAVLEIIHGTQKTSELEALFSLLRQHGVYARLFRKLDGEVLDLLQYVGDFRQAGALNWRYLVDIFVGGGQLPDVALSGPDALEELQQLAGGLSMWFWSNVDSIRLILTRPGEVAEGLQHLVELIWTLEQARWGDPQAIAFVTRMVQEAGTAIMKALRGLEYAEELGTSFGNRSGQEHIGADLIGRLKYALLFEILSWFIGVGEIKAAISAAELPERIAALARVLRSLRLVGRAARAGSEAARLEHVLAAVARIAGVVERARILRLAELLPEEHLAVLGRIAEAVHLPRGAGIDALKAALVGNQELLRAVDEVGNAMAVASRLEAKAAGVGGITADMKIGLHILLRNAPNEEVTLALARLIDDIPAAHLDEFLRTMAFIKSEHFGQWTVEALSALAQRPKALAFMREAGSDLFGVAFRHRGNWSDWAGFERFLDGLALKRSQIGNPAEYQRFLDRLLRGEASAFNEVDEALRVQRLAEAAKTGQVAALGLARLREGSRAHLLAELEQIERISGVAARDEYAAEIARLSDKEVSGLEHMASLEHTPRGEVQSRLWDWTDALKLPADQRTSLLTVVDDIAPRTVEGLERALHRCFDDFQGGLGQLLAARTLITKYGANELRLELMTSRNIGSQLVRREFDIEAKISGRAVHVEVKTNMPGGISAARASREWEQIVKDLAIHARSNYDDLLYLYHPGVKNQLPDLGREMLELFGDASTPPDPDLLRLLSNQGVNINDARQSFQRWLTNNGLTTYDL